MAEDAITVRLRLRDAKRFQADASRSAEALEEIDDATVTIGKRRGVLSRFAGSMGMVSRSARGASGSLGGTESAMAGVAKGAVVARLAILALKVGSIGLAVVMAAPLLVSLAAAAGGMAALGVAAGGVLVAGLALGAGAAAKFREQADVAGTSAHQLKGAFAGMGQAANKAISPGAAAAMRGLARGTEALTPMVASLRGAFRSMGRDAGSALHSMGKDLVELGPELREMIRGSGGAFKAWAPAVAPLLGILLDIANAAMPHLVALGHSVTNTLRGWRGAMQGANLGGIIGTLVAHFKTWLSIGGNLIGMLAGIGRALAPMGAGMAGGLERATGAASAFLNSAKGIATVRGIFAVIAKVVGVVAKVFGFVAKHAITAGKMLVEAFAPAMPFFENILLPLLKGIAQGILVGLVGAFLVAVQIIKVVATVLGFLGTHLAFLKPVFQALGQVIGFVFANAILGLIGLLGKLGPAFKVVATVAKVAVVPFKLVGAVIGKLIGIVGRAASALGSRLPAAWRMVTAAGRNALAFVAGLPGRFLGAAARIVISVVRGFQSMGGKVLGVLRGAFNRVLGFVTGLAGRFLGAGKKIGNAIWQGIKNAVTGAAGFIGDIGKAIKDFINKHTIFGDTIKLGPIGSVSIPALAGGGTIPVGGMALVGEAGPELAENRGGRTKVTPLTRAAMPSVGTLDAGSKSSRAGQVIVPVYLNGREIARAVGRDTDDRLARK